MRITMYNKIKNWIQARKNTKTLSGPGMLHPGGQWQPSTTPNIGVFEPSDTITLVLNKEEIFRINGDGKAEWIKEDSYDEAAEVFLNSVNWKIESEAGIRQSREEWEKSIVERLKNAAEANGGSLTTDELTDVVRKCIMYSKLKGTK